MAAPPLGSTPAQAAAKPPPDKDQSLAFKVMRLCRPSFHQYTPVYAEEGDVLGDIGAVGSESDGRAGDGFGLTGMLTLPPNFGNIFMGENFSSYISAVNQTDSTVSSVGIKAELQTKTKRLTLLDTTEEPVLSFAGGENRDFVVESPLRELGTHILVCSAQYVNAAGEKRAFRQFFKFQVQPAFVVKHEARPIAHGTSAGALLLEVSVQSCLPGPAFLESVAFREAPTFTHAAWSGKPNTPGADADAGECFLAPSDVRQYLYKLTANTVLPHQPVEPVLVGQFDMVWRSALGERGQLQQTIEYHPPSAAPVAESVEGAAVEEAATAAGAGREVDLTIARIPSVDGTIDAGLRSQQIFEVELVVTNAGAVSRSFVLMPAALKLSNEGRAALRESMGGDPGAGVEGGEWRVGVQGVGPEDGIEAERVAADAITKDAIASRLSDMSLEGPTFGEMASSENNAAGVVWAGLAPLTVGIVGPRSTVSVVARFFPCCAGEHQLPALALVDVAVAAEAGGPQRFEDFKASPRLLIT